MEVKNDVNINYSKKYRESLFLFVKDAQVHGKKTLESLVISKSEEYDKNLKDDPNNPKVVILFSILKLSQYFIEGNQFIKDDYFNHNENKIYKAFYDLLKNPSNEQFENFISSFENLDYGGDIVFLICESFFEQIKFLACDMFFRIAFKKHFDSLQGYFDFPINPNRDELILNLSSFVKIKNNKKEFTKLELVDLFRKKEENKSDSMIEKNNTQQKNSEISKTDEKNNTIENKKEDNKKKEKEN